MWGIPSGNSRPSRSLCTSPDASRTFTDPVLKSQKRVRDNSNDALLCAIAQLRALQVLPVSLRNAPQPAAMPCGIIPASPPAALGCLQRLAQRIPHASPRAPAALPEIPWRPDRPRIAWSNRGSMARSSSRADTAAPARRGQESRFLGIWDLGTLNALKRTRGCWGSPDRLRLIL